MLLQNYKKKNGKLYISHNVMDHIFGNGYQVRNKEDDDNDDSSSGSDSDGGENPYGF